jgi:hypothetical protein
MRFAPRPTTRRRSVLAIAAVVLVAAPAALATAGTVGAKPSGGDHHAQPARSVTAKQVAFHDAMRTLWEDHITWTRLTIVSFAAGLPDLPANQARLLENQTDIGTAVKPYYGRAAGNRLTALLEEHIRGAVAVLVAAKAGDQAQIKAATAAWYANGNEIADFLSKANPRHWPKREMRAMMKDHLDLTLREATHRLQGDFAADIRDYERIHAQILEMADMLSEGIIRQFPRRFR